RSPRAMAAARSTSKLLARRATRRSAHTYYRTFVLVVGGIALPQNFVDPAGQVCLKTNPTGGNDDERVQQASRHDLARALAPRYAHASRRQKGQILDEFCAITGLTRKHALALLGNPPAEQPVSNYRGRPPSYGPAEVAL